MAYNINKSAERIIENEGIVPYEKQTPEQRAQLLGRIKSLIHVGTIGEQLRSNFPYIVGSIPNNPSSKELKLLLSKLKAIKREIPTLISFSNNMNSIYQSLCTQNQESRDQFDGAGIYLSNIIANTQNLSLQQIEILSEFTKSLMKNEVNALSDEDHDQQMIDFANHALTLYNQGRKKITKNDLKKFLNK